MIKLSNSYILRIITRLLILLAIAKAISLAVWWFLPSDGVELQVKNNYKPKYMRVDFRNMLDTTSAIKSKTSETISSTGINITNMILKGLYGRDAKGFAIVALKSSPKKTSIVSVGEVFSEYTLKTILSDGVVFMKAGKEYVLKMQNNKLSKQASKSSITAVDAPRNVSRQDIEQYAKNPKKIWQDISISEVKKGKNIEGFKVTRVKKNSQMESLGLMSGDVIIKVNNVELTSYKDALDVYKNIDKLEVIQIVIIRNNREKELIYEIN